MSDRASFVPDGASSRWPFVIGTEHAERPPAWNARLLLQWGLLEAVLHLQPRREKVFWRKLPTEYLATFLHTGAVGITHPSRHFIAKLVREGERVLDVGCGPGVNYEVLASERTAFDYVGVDIVDRMLEVAQNHYPSASFQYGSAKNLVSQFGERSFDVVIVRHVLEHLPDFEAALVQAMAVARRQVIVGFFLTPRHLPLGVRKINLHFRPSVFLYVYSRPAIDAVLQRAGVRYTWHDRIGASRAGWFAGEMNSVLVVELGA